MGENIKIPFIKEFPQLYAGFGIPYISAFTEIDLFHYENAKSCTVAIPPYRTNFYQIFFLHHSQLSGNYNLTEFENLVRNNYSLIRSINDYAHLLYITLKCLSDALKKKVAKQRSKYSRTS
jgi:hypothetical protein